MTGEVYRELMSGIWTGMAIFAGALVGHVFLRWAKRNWTRIRDLVDPR